MMAGDEFYGDDVTSGPYDEDAEAFQRGWDWDEADWHDEVADGGWGDAWAAQYDDDPSPYDGTYSEC